jgi:hypothetical protein
VRSKQVSIQRLLYVFSILQVYSPIAIQRSLSFTATFEIEIHKTLYSMFVVLDVTLIPPQRLVDAFYELGSNQAKGWFDMQNIGGTASLIIVNRTPSRRHHGMFSGL